MVGGPLLLVVDVWVLANLQGCEYERRGDAVDNEQRLVDRLISIPLMNSFN